MNPWPNVTIYGIPNCQNAAWISIFNRQNSKITNHTTNNREHSNNTATKQQ